MDLSLASLYPLSKLQAVWIYHWQVYTRCQNYKQYGFIPGQSTLGVKIKSNMDSSMADLHSVSKLQVVRIYPWPIIPVARMYLSLADIPGVKITSSVDLSLADIHPVSKLQAVLI